MHKADTLNPATEFFNVHPLDVNHRLRRNANHLEWRGAHPLRAAAPGGRSLRCASSCTYHRRRRMLCRARACSALQWRSKTPPLIPELRIAPSIGAAPMLMTESTGLDMTCASTVA